MVAAEVPEALTPAAAVEAQTSYSRAIAGIVGRATVGGGALVVLIGLASLLTSIGSGASLREPMVLPAVLERDPGLMALGFLIPLAIALQVLPRLSRDPETTAAVDAIAQRQFWGGVSAILALVAAVVTLSTLIHEVVLGLRSMTIDVVELLIVFCVGAAAMFLSADAAVLARSEADRLRLAAARRAKEVRQLESAAERIHGRQVRYPVVALVTQGIAIGLVAIGLGMLAPWWLTGYFPLALAYAFIAAVLLLVVLCIGEQVVRSAVLGEILTCAAGAAAIALILFVYMASSGAAFLPTMAALIEPVADAYVASMAFGVLTGAPALITLAFVTVPRGPKRTMAPMLALIRLKLRKQIKRLECPHEPTPTAAPWRALAWAAIVMCIVPVAGLLVAMLATWQRRDSTDQRRALLAWAWTAPALLLLLQLAALMLLPIYGVALGWFSET